MSMSGINQLTIATFHGMNDKSAIVTFSPTRYFCFREHSVQHPEHSLDLVVVPLDCTRDLLLVEVLEPCSLAEVGPVSSPQMW
jgi:hypothetical protein